MAEQEQQKEDPIDYADSLWLILEKKYPFLRDVSTGITEKRKQLQNKEVLISVFGRHNCGKSTLLNALLRNRLLPMDMDNETCVEIKIRHDPTVHPGPCLDNHAGGGWPRLVKEPGGEIIASGAEEIEIQLRKENSNVRKTGVVTSEKYSLVLYTFVPILDDAPVGWNLALLDTPGFGEAHVKNVIARTNTLFTTSTAYLYIIDNSSMDDEVDAKKIQHLYNQDKDLFNDSRLVVAINKFDQRFTQDRRTRRSPRNRDPPDLANIGDKLKERTQSFISTSIKCKDLPDLPIVPVSAQWATTALWLRTEPHEDDVKEAEAILRNYPDPPPQGQGESSALDLANSLDTICGLPILEISLKSVINQCIEVWRTSLSKAYTVYLQRGQLALEEKQSVLAEEKQHCAPAMIESNDTGVSGILQLHETFNEKKNQLYCMGYIEKNQKPDIEIRLERKYTDIDEPTAKDLLHERIDMLIQLLENQMKQKFSPSEQPFLQKDFHKVIKKFLDEQAQPTLRDAQPHIKLEGVAATFRDAIDEMNELDFQIEGIAAEILPTNWSPVSDKLWRDRASKQEKNIITTEVLRNQQLTLSDLHQHISAPPLEVGLIQRFLDWITKKFGGNVTPREDRPYKAWSRDMDGALDALKTELTKAVDIYISSTLKEWVIQEVVGVAYRNRVKLRAEAVGETYTSAIKEAKSKTEKEMANCASESYMDGLATDIAKLRSAIYQLKT